MDWEQRFDAFQFKNHLLVNNNIQLITAVQLHALIRDRQRDLSFDFNISHSQFMTQTLFISRLQQAGSELRVNFNCRTTNFMS